MTYFDMICILNKCFHLALETVLLYKCCKCIKYSNFFYDNTAINHTKYFLALFTHNVNIYSIFDKKNVQLSFTCLNLICFYIHKISYLIVIYASITCPKKSYYMYIEIMCVLCKYKCLHKFPL